MKVSKKGVLDSSTEEKIKEAARKIFMQKGFAAAKTRDIAEEAGINMALLNYYFRSKEKLFDIVVDENTQRFMHGIIVLFNDETTSIEKKLELLVAGYIDMLCRFPDIPIFFLNEMRNNPAKLATKLGTVKNTFFVKQFEQAVKEGKLPPLNPIHLFVNMCSLLMFPFAASPMLKGVGNMSQAEFNELMQERKRLIPLWLNAMLTVK
jgi:AcrR family transcriptional regulator